MMRLIDGHGAGDVDKTGNTADARPQCRVVLDAAEKRDQRAWCGDDEGVGEQGLGDGGHAS